MIARDADIAGKKIAGQKQPILHAATRRIGARTRRGLGVGVGARATGEPFGRALRHHVGAVGRGLEAFRLQRRVKRRLPRRHLAGDLGAGDFAAQWIGQTRPRDQCRRVFGGHQKTHLLGEHRLGHIDAGDARGTRQCRPAAHARIHRPGQMNALAVAALDQSAVIAFHHRETDIERIAQTEQFFAARQIAAQGARIKFKMVPAAFVQLHQRQIVDHIEGQQRQIAARAVGRDVFHAISLRFHRVLRNDMVIGDCQPVRTDQKTGAGGGFLRGAIEQRANLQQARFGIAVNGFGAGRQDGCGGLRIGRWQPAADQRAGQGETRKLKSHRWARRKKRCLDCTVPPTRPRDTAGARQFINSPFLRMTAMSTYFPP